eukprot:Hpha_TRINITY_DN28343_c0_g1::TRINITY_DN28343_c0_g1_i1::g.2249::m.2249
MAKSSPIPFTLFIFRRDMRLLDNRALSYARSLGLPVLHLVCLAREAEWIGKSKGGSRKPGGQRQIPNIAASEPRMGANRRRFWFDCARDLALSLAETPQKRFLTGDAPASAVTSRIGNMHTVKSQFSVKQAVPSYSLLIDAHSPDIAAAVRNLTKSLLEPGNAPFYKLAHVVAQDDVGYFEKCWERGIRDAVGAYAQETKVACSCRFVFDQTLVNVDRVPGYPACAAKVDRGTGSEFDPRLDIPDDEKTRSFFRTGIPDGFSEFKNKLERQVGGGGGGGKG